MSAWWRCARERTYVIGFWTSHEMVDREVSFNSDQSPLPEHKRRVPGRDKLRARIVERLLNKPCSVEGEFQIKIRHRVWVVGRLQ